jgi:hypothetical protein
MMDDKEYNELHVTRVTKYRDKDEYWGYWEQCSTCKVDMIAGAVYCPRCGRRIDRSKND